MDKVVLTDIDFRFKKAAVLKRMGFMPKSTKITPIMQDMIDSEVKEAQEKTRGSSVYRHFAIKKIRGGTDTIQIMDNKKEAFNSKYLAKHLINCSRITLLASTIGAELEGKVKDLQKNGSGTRAVITDAIASVAVEAVTDHVNNIIKREITRSGYQSISRFSPGYGDWHLSNQRIIFRLLLPEEIGIKLTEALIMVPEKSVTAVIGWKEEENA